MKTMNIVEVAKGILAGGPKREVRLTHRYGEFILQVWVSGNAVLTVRNANLEALLLYVLSQTSTNTGTLWFPPGTPCAAACRADGRVPYCHCQACGETGVAVTVAEGYCLACISDTNADVERSPL